MDELSAVERMELRLSKITRVSGYRRRGVSGNSEKVSAYVRKDLDSWNGGKTKTGAFAQEVAPQATTTGPPQGWQPYGGTKINPFMSDEQFAERLKGGAYRTDGATVDFQTDIDPADRDRFLGKVSDVVGRLNLPFNVAIVVPEKQGGGRFVEGGSADQVNMRISIPGNLLAAKNADFMNAPNKTHMDAYGTDGVRFNVTHEIGHILDAQNEDTKNARAENKFWRSQTDGLSQYGREIPGVVGGNHSRAEGYAEAFAQYVLRDGTDSTDPKVQAQNATADAYAARYGWDRLLKNPPPTSLSAADSDMVALAKITRVSGYRRRGVSGNSEKVSSYVRKDLDSWNGSKTKKGAFAQEVSAPNDAPKVGDKVGHKSQIAAVADRGDHYIVKITTKGTRSPTVQKIPKKGTFPQVSAPAAQKSQADLKAGFRRKSSSGAKIATYSVPETQDWLSKHPVDPKNILDMYDQATPGEKDTGKNWYPDAHAIAQEMSKAYGVTPRQAAGMIAAYSPQTPWGRNLMVANEVLRTRVPVGGKGAHLSIVKTPNDLQETRYGVMSSGVNNRRARALLDGTDFEEVFGGKRNKNGSLPPKALKIRAFAELIARGGQDPNKDVPDVVVDRHAAGVARGVRLTEDDYAIEGPSSSKVKYEAYATAYRDAAKVLSKREGREVTPEEIQATTWLTRQRLNMADIKARRKLGDHDVTDSLNYFASYDPTVADVIDDPMVGYATLHPDPKVRKLAADLQAHVGLSAVESSLEKVLRLALEG